MNVYQNKVIDWVVAESAEDAADVLREYCKTIGSDGPDERDLEFSLRPADKSLTIDNEVDETKLTLLPAEWVALKGRGFLATTEF
jgi:hypothetical protein